MEIKVFNFLPTHIKKVANEKQVFKKIVIDILLCNHCIIIVFFHLTSVI
jgi:hypothetical protein